MKRRILPCLCLLLIPGVLAHGQMTLDQELPVTETRFQELATEYESRLEQAKTYAEEEAIRTRLADLYRYQEDYTSALRQYRVLLEKPEFAQSPQRLSVLDRMASLLQETGNLEEAVAIYEAILQEYDDAMALKPKGSRHDPGYLSTLLDLEGAYEDLGDYNAARETCLKLLAQPDEGIQSIVLDRLINLYDYEALTDDEMRAALSSVREGPNMARAYYRLADIYSRRGFLADAMECHKKVLDLLPEQYGLESDGLFKVYSEAENLDGLVSVLNEYIKNYPARTIYVRLLFETLCHQGKEDEALVELQSRAQASRDPRLNEELARFLLNRGKYQDAETIIADLMKRYPETPAYYDLLASAYRGQGRIDDAVNVWKQQLDSRPTETGYISLARILRNEGKTDEAIQLMRTAKGPNIDPSRFLHELYLMLLESNRAQEAMDTLQELFAQRPQESHIARDRARNAVNDLKSHEALMAAVETTLQRAEVRNNPVVKSLFLGMYLDIANDSKRYNQAIAFLSSSALSRTDGDLCLYNLGRRLIMTQDYVNAIASLSAVSTQSRFFADTVSQLGSAYLQSGQYEKAKESLSRFVAPATDAAYLRSPDPMINYSALYQLAGIAVTLHQPGEALKWLNQLAALPKLSGFSRMGQGLEDLYFGHALSQLGSLEDAAHRYELAARSGSEAADEARYRLADVLLWKGQPDKAMEAYKSISAPTSASAFADEALARRAVLLEITDEALELYTSADFFAWQGRTEDAINKYRELAIQMEGSDTAAWATYEIANLKSADGDVDGAVREYDKVLEKTDHAVLRGLAQLAIADLTSANDTLPREIRDEAFKKVIVASPDSLYASIARMRLQGARDALPY